LKTNRFAGRTGSTALHGQLRHHRRAKTGWLVRRTDSDAAAAPAPRC
jgi:hypothetical protein